MKHLALLSTVLVLCVNVGLTQDLIPCSTTDQMLPREWVCNGIEDCEDGSDERSCDCEEDEFQCASGNCISSLWRCDSYSDCRDGSDEVDCGGSGLPARNCLSRSFECDNGHCIREVYVCDQDDDCGDGSDERNCTHTDSTQRCAEHQFMCSSNECISNSWVCDNQPDCSDMSDEMDCIGSNFICGSGFFNCTNFGCINVNLVCDGSSDCPRDNSDEEDCPLKTCLAHEFQCPDEDVGCIPLEWKCDGEDDCGDFTDELNCGGVCGINQFECSTGGCANTTSKCDGILDCRDGSDEFVCGHPRPHVECEENKFPCANGLKCIDTNLVCSQTSQCDDGSDELPKLCARTLSQTTSCLVNNGGCDHLCHTNSHNVVLCTCSHGYRLSEDLTTCQDIDECEYPFQCDQLCLNMDGGFSCSCAEGYVDHPTEGCKATGPPATLLFSNREDIRTISLDNRQLPSLLVRNLHNCVALDYHYSLNYIFWTDATQDVIKRSNLRGENIVNIIDNNLGDPDGLAVDWVSDKLYWTDAAKGHIEVSSLNGENRKVLFSTNLGEPRAIVVDPAAGYLFWTDWGRPSPKIERSSMAGTNRTVLHLVHIVWPNGLTVDYVTQSIYWADAKLRVIETSFYDGSHRRPILTSGVRHVFAMTFFESYIYWTEWETRSIFSVSKTIGQRLTEIDENAQLANITEVQTNLFRPMDIHVVHPLIQRSTVNPCAPDNGGCEYLCLLNAGPSEGYSCACPTGLELASNGKKCNPLKTFILFAHRTDIRRVSLDTSTVVDVVLPLSNLSGATGLDWDDQSDQLFWTDIFLNTISVASLNGSNQHTLLSNDIITPAGLAVDWISRKLYWTDDADFERIEVAELDGSNRAIVVFGNLDKPRGIVVHPARGVMFWTDWGRYPRIERANLDGTDRLTIVADNLEFPNGLAIDFDRDRIFWCDGGGQIESTDFNGNSRQVLLNTSLPHPFGLTIHNEWIYWSDWSSNSIERANKYTGLQRMSLVQDLDSPMDVHIFHRNRTQIDNHPCMINNGGCSHLCLSRPTANQLGVEVSCYCPTGYVLMSNRLTCNNYINNYLLFSTASELRQISLDTDYLTDFGLPISTFRAATSVAVDILTDDIYWTDSLEAKIFKVPMGGGERMEVVTNGLKKPESLTIDWIGRNLYWVDSGLERIEVANLEVTSRLVLFSTSLTHVTSIAIDLKSHLMFWIDAGNQLKRIPGKIEKATMDGTNRRTVISGSLGQPRNIVIDNYSGVGARIYWTDSLQGRIECADFEGDERTVIIELPQESLASPFGLTISGEHIYWTDINSNSLSRALKSDGSAQVEILSDLLDVSGITSVSKADLQRIAAFLHGCDGDQSCSNLCLPNIATSIYTCACSTGLSLLDDRMTCRKFPSVYVLVASTSTIRRISLDDSERYDDVTIVDSLQNTLSLDYILTSDDDGLMFFGDINLRAIYAANLNGTGKRVLISGANLTQGIAVDWVGRNIYWTDSGTKTIEVADINGLHRKTLISTDVDKPRAIVVHPGSFFFWSDWGSEPKIERVSLDGTERQAIVSSEIAWPNGLTLDREGHRVYWTDGHINFRNIYSIDYNGFNRKVVVTLSHISNDSPFGMAFYNGFVFWIDWQHAYLFRARVNDAAGSLNRVLIENFRGSRPIQPVVVNMNNPREGELSPSGPCAEDNGGCTYLCLQLSTTERRCACPDGADESCREFVGSPGSISVTTISDQPTPSIATSREVLTTHKQLTQEPDEAASSDGIETAVPTRSSVNTTINSSYGGYLSISNWFMIIFGVLFLVSLFVVTVTAIVIARWIMVRNAQEENVCSPPRRLDATNPNCNTSNKTSGRIPLFKIDSETVKINTVEPEKVIGNLLPKRHNNDPRRCPPSPTSANIFVNEPDIMVIPEPVRKKRSKPPQRISPLANYSTLVHQGTDLDQSPSPPLPPKNTLERIPSCSSTPCSPKLDNVEERSKLVSKSVRFDVSIPPEEEPPTLPQRGIPVTHSNPHIAMVTDTSVASSDGSGSDGKESEVTISTEVASSSSGEDHQATVDSQNSTQVSSMVGNSADLEPISESIC